MRIPTTVRASTGQGGEAPAAPRGAGAGRPRARRAWPPDPWRSPAWTRALESLRRPGRAVDQERGNASVEFIGWSVILLIPTLYLLVTLSQIQAASFAVASAADIASRILEVDHSPQALSHARTAAGLALSDQGVEADPATAVSVSCEGRCTGTVVLRVEAAVDLPGLAAIGLGRDVVVLEAQRAVDLSAKEES